MFGDGDTFPVSVTLRGELVGQWKLGRGTYRAFQVDPIVEVIASGEVEANVRVMLISSPMAIFPPQYSLVFLVPEVVLPMQRAFLATASFRTEEAIGKIIITDMDRSHEVDVQQSPL